MSTPDIPAEAVDAGLDWYEHDAPAGCDHWGQWGPPEGMPTLCLRCKWEGMLVAALPHLREQWLVKVEGALRDGRLSHCLGCSEDRPTECDIARLPLILRDVLGAKEATP